MGRHGKFNTDIYYYTTYDYSAARGSLYGALDAQLALVEFIVKLPANSAINANILSLFESAVKISKEIIDIQETVVPNIDAEDSEMDVTVCFQQVPSKNKGS